jgi:glycine cleavage system H protein
MPIRLRDSCFVTTEECVIPGDLRYTAEHEWVAGDGSGPVRVGITHFAQDALGDIVFVSLPAAGTQVSTGQVLGEVESTKSVSEIYAPFDGEVVSRNEELESRPELLNTDAYGEGWIVTIRPASSDAAAGLLEPAAYEAMIGSSA